MSIHGFKNIRLKTLAILTLIAIGILNYEIEVNAKIIPDKTLRKEASKVSKKNNRFIIDGGAKRGSSLFHSFLKFSILKGMNAQFLDPINVDNIFVRVTGNSSSKIAGKLGVKGSANLFFMNPNGIIFTKSSNLNINGSFLATTADSILFPNNFIYSSVNPKPVSLIKIGLPIGFNVSRGQIIVRGKGHNLYQGGNPFTPIFPIGSLNNGLTISSGNTFGLLASNIIFDNGVVTAPSGNIRIGAVSDGEVGINFNKSGFQLDYLKVNVFGDIKLSKFSLIGSSGTENGNINIYADNINLKDFSLIYNSNIGVGDFGDIKINATGMVKVSTLSDFTIDNQPPLDQKLTVASGIISETYLGSGGAISISADKLLIKDAGVIGSLTFGSGQGGDIRIRSNELRLEKTSPLGTPADVSLLNSSTAGTGEAGNIFIDSSNVYIQDGSQISSIVFGDGQGGNVNINASTIKINGYVSGILSPSLLSSITLGSGNAGNLRINTDKLFVTNGGRVDSSTLNSGDSGSITIDASDFVLVNGIIPGSLNPSLIIASANKVDPAIGDILDLPPVPSGDSGNVTINTPKFTVSGGAQVTVRNDGKGAAGVLNISADMLNLDNGKITASTKAGQGGVIDINAKNIYMKQSRISASAKSLGDGGNIFINSETLIGDNRSLISANAQGGVGGKVIIDSQGIIFDRNQITATSDSGPQFDGVVQINSNIYDPNSSVGISLTPLPSIVSLNCQDKNGFYVVSSQYPDDNVLELSDVDIRVPLVRDKTTGQLTPLKEMSSWSLNADGTVRGISTNSSVPLKYCYR
ncbi:MAG TPA: filamentous hemagglutinin N-terminal domain-containing protein [Stenomitos sp.]